MKAKHVAREILQSLADRKGFEILDELDEYIYREIESDIAVIILSKLRVQE